ncbi:MAG: ATP-binding protein [Nitrospirae bacterium]|nr:MAG: ATP-binding protein [Nitrospirota bacterium]
MTDPLKLPIEALAPSVHVERLGFKDTSELVPLEEPLGQERAVEALEFGLRMPSPGFNIYVSGPIGSGKWALAKDMVKRLAKSAPPPHDWCYVNNFQDPSRPKCLSFPAARGRTFKQAMATLIDGLRRDVPKIFESTTYLEAKAKLVEDMEGRKKALFKELTEIGRARGFSFEETPMGFGLVPLRAGHPMTEEELEALSGEDRRVIVEKRKALEGEIREFHIRVHALDREAEERVHEMDRQVIKNILAPRFETLRRAYDGLEQVLEYVNGVHEDILTNYKDFLPKEAPSLPILGLEAGGRRPDLTRYQVNLVVEHAIEGGAPVVDESHPTYANLIGKIERKAHLGVVFTDFTEIKAGAVLQASGGYLILSAMDLLRQPFAWDALKRVIKTREVKIEDPGEFFGFSTTGLRPQPVPVDVKVVMVGPPILYHLLQAYEEDFQKIFKVKADFDVDMARDENQDKLYGRFVARLCREEGLPHFGAEAVAEVIRHGSRLAERHDRLSLRLSLLADVVREAAFWARREGRVTVSQADVETAIAKKRHRANLPEQWVQDEIKEGTLIVALEGTAVGQINGLSVHLMGDYAFGRPCRITARTSIGTKGVIDVQREAELAGHIHSKGVLTLAGYLAGKFASTHPFALNATLTFEQTYSEVEGDSAALAELAAILSSLAEVPIRQYLAITGSVNQLGEVQPIGGVNEKIEGFFESCKRSGLTGEQGVIIPVRNTKHLALRREVVEAVKSGTFSVYAVNTVEEALELLTGLPAGVRGPDGQYPEGTLYGKVAKRLEEMAQIVTEWGEDKKELND